MIYNNIQNIFNYKYLLFTGDVQKINKLSSLYENISIVCFVIFIAFIIISIVLYFKLNIRHSISMLTGIGAKKEIERLSKSAAMGNGYDSKNKGKIKPIFAKAGKLNNNVQNIRLIDDKTSKISYESFDKNVTQILEQNAANTLQDEFKTKNLNNNISEKNYNISTNDATFDKTTLLDNKKVNDNFIIDTDIVISYLNKNN